MNYPEPTECGKPSQRESLIKLAGKMVGLDLEKPIDCSQMIVHDVRSEPMYEDNRYYIMRTASLFAYVINEYGEREELEIHFALKSNRNHKV